MKNDSFEIAMLIKEIYGSTLGKLSCNIKESNLTPQQIMVIKLIAHNGKINITTLCNEMSLSKGTVSGIVKRLEGYGLVKKIKSEEDKRTTFVTFSNKGLEFAKEFREEIHCSFDNIFEDLKKEEAKEIKEVLLKLRDKIKK